MQLHFCDFWKFFRTDMFKVNNKNTRTTSMTSFWCLYCKLKTYLSPSSSVSVDFEEINVSWECRTTLCPHKTNFFPQKTPPSWWTSYFFIWLWLILIRLLVSYLSLSPNQTYKVGAQLLFLSLLTTDFIKSDPLHY